jgi:hypothetical protein
MYSHFIITRFNLVHTHPKYNTDKNGNKTLTDSWLEGRFKLFDDFCFPSIQNQTNLDFKWLVLFSASTPKHFKERISTYASTFSNFVPLYFEDGSDTPTLLKKEINALLPDSQEYLITTRIDNDDAFHEDMVANIQNRFSKQQDVIFNFDNGIQYDTTYSVLCEVTYLNNAFTTRIERIVNGNFETGVFIKHTQINQVVGSVQYIKTQPLWLQVIHDGNVSNSLKIKKLIFSPHITKGFNINYPISISKINSIKQFAFFNKYSIRITNLWKKFFK